MPTIEELEKRILDLGMRVRELEAELKTYQDEKEYMDALLIKAKEIVNKYNRSTAVFLQTKLLIDHFRASKLVEKLKSDGIIE